MARTVEIGGQTYRIGNLPVIPAQLDLVRRVKPVYDMLLPEVLQRVASRMAQLPEGEAGQEDIRSRVVATVLEEYVMIAASKFSDTDFHFITDLCLSVCERMKPGGISFGVVKPKGGVLAFQDISANDVIGLILQTILENLGSFFPSAAPASAEAT